MGTNFLTSSWRHPDQEVRQPEPEAVEQPRQPGEGLQQEALAHPLSTGNIQMILRKVFKTM